MALVGEKKNLPEASRAVEPFWNFEKEVERLEFLCLRIANLDYPNTFQNIECSWLYIPWFHRETLDVLCEYRDITIWTTSQ